MNATGYISKVVSGEGFYTFTPFPDTHLIEKQQITEVDVNIHDGRTLSPKQRNKIHALIGDITDYLVAPGSDRKRRERYEMETFREMGLLYLIDSLDGADKSHDRYLVRKQLTQSYCNLLSIDIFSLSDESPYVLDMSTARDFIDWLVELCVKHGIPCIDTLLNRCEDTGRYIYACIANKRCCITGKKAQLHHVDAVGMGRDRRDIIHKGMRVLPLHWKLHSKAHTIGKKSFEEKYHVSGIALDDDLCSIWKVKH